MKPDQRRLELRKRLLQAAERTVAQDGLDALRARALATEVKCSVGQIYNIFPDLDALILAVNAQTLSELGEKVTSAMTTPNPATPDEAFQNLTNQARAYLEFARDNRNRWQAVFQHRLTESRELPDWYRELKEELFSHVATPLQRLLPDMPAEKRQVLGRTIFSAVHGVVSLGVEERLAEQSFEQLSDQLDIVVGAMVRGLQSQAPS